MKQSHSPSSVAHHSDIRPSFPGWFHQLRRGLSVSLFGGYLAGLGIEYYNDSEWINSPAQLAVQHACFGPAVHYSELEDSQQLVIDAQIETARNDLMPFIQSLDDQQEIFLDMNRIYVCALTSSAKEAVGIVVDAGVFTSNDGSRFLMLSPELMNCYISVDGDDVAVDGCDELIETTQHELIHFIQAPGLDNWFAEAHADALSISDIEGRYAAPQLWYHALSYDAEKSSRHSNLEAFAIRGFQENLSFSVDELINLLPQNISEEDRHKVALMLADGRSDDAIRAMYYVLYESPESASWKEFFGQMASVDSFEGIIQRQYLKVLSMDAYRSRIRTQVDVFYTFYFLLFLGLLSPDLIAILRRLSGLSLGLMKNGHR